MPCESCNTQFSVFKRKRSCSECRRLYCNHCLVKRRDKLLCERCVVFTTRPLTKVELLKLKPKDLIFYLQSKHISTTGCVEKDELVNLVLAHIDSTRLPSDHESFRSFGNSPTGNSPESNPFDQIRQTCQNLFQSFTDKIATDLNFDIKPSSSGQQQNIFSQPRSSTRHSQSNRSHNSSTTTTSINENIVLNNIPLSSPSSPPTPPVPRNPINTSLSAASSPPSNSDNNSVASSRITSPSNSTCDDSNSAASIKSSARMSNNRDPTVPTIITKKNIPNDLPSVHSNNLGNENKSTKKFFDKYSSDINGSGCECSEDEAIRHQKSKHKKMSQSTSNLLTTEHPNLPGPSGSGNMTKNYRENKHTIKANNGCNSDSLEESSSFEELGAVGRNSSDVDTWQFINKNFEVEFDEEDQNSRRHQNEFAKKKLHKKVKNSYKCDNEDTGKASNNNFLQYQHKQQSTSNSQEETASSSGEVSSRIRKLTRRRSDSCIIQSPSHKYDNAEFGDRNVDEDSSRKRSRKSCQRCGKTKNDLKKHVIRFRRQLEILHTSDVEVKQQLDAVLKFLENKTKSSFECSDTDSQSNHSENDHEPVAVNSETARREHSQEHNFMNENDGIYVYPTIRTETVRPTINIEKPRIYVRQYVKLDDISSSSDLEDLTVKQLKEILMLNRVDFKGCCEKTELLERVRRLWKDHRSSPSVDKLPTDDLCKICMDAPIECVILECGHMASCTNCGKVLNECPICRQYIVRVVRFFRA